MESAALAICFFLGVLFAVHLNSKLDRVLEAIEQLPAEVERVTEGRQ